MSDDEVLQAVTQALGDAEDSGGLVDAEEFIRLLREHYGYEVRRIDDPGSADG